MYYMLKEFGKFGFRMKFFGEEIKRGKAPGFRMKLIFFINNVIIILATDVIDI